MKILKTMYCKFDKVGIFLWVCHWLEYLSKTNEAVPPKYGNRVFYPLNLVENDPCSVILRKELTSYYPPQKGISYHQFENGVVIVNHTSYPFDTSFIEGDKYFVLDSDNILVPHSAMYVSY